MTDRATQITEATDIAETLRRQGWNRVVISVSRGGTFKIEAEAVEKAQRQAWGSGRK